MAISYDDWKKQYEGMTTEQQKNYASMIKWNATAEAYAKQYIQEKQNAGTYGQKTTPTYSTPTQSTNTSSSNNYSSNSNNQNGSTYDYSSNNGTTNNTWTTNTSNTNNNNNTTSSGSPLSDWKNGNGWTYWKFTFDADEFLDESKFWKSNWEISVKEWTAAQTGRPDYEINTKERLTEMVNNLNTYWDTNPEFFNDRETFNRVFEYNTRQSQAQRDLLDSYWKKAQDYKKASSYNNSASFTSDLDSWNVSESEFEALKKYNQDVYIQWQKEMQDKLNAAIANLANPFSIDDMTTALNKIVEKFNLQAWDPYDIIWGWNQMMEKTWAWDSMKQAQQHYAAADDAIAQIKRIQTNYSSSTWGNQSDALVAARLQKALLPYETLLSNELSAWQHWQSLYNTQLGTANNYANTIQMQAQEDQRIFNNKIKALWFAMDVYSYRTPEQKAQLELQVQSIKNDMSLLQKSKENDLALYNMSATTRLQNQLNYEMQDLTVTDPKQLRANLSNVLDQWYEQYWDIIQRPKSQVIEDVIAYAKANNMSVWEALRKNFVEPLMSKQEYKNSIASKYPEPENKYQTKWKQTMDKDGNITWTAEWYWELQDMFRNITNRKWVQNAMEELSNSVWDAESFIAWLKQLYPEWTYWGECWAFVNDVLSKWFWDSTHLWNDFLTEKLVYRNKGANEKPKTWDVYLMSSKTNSNWHTGMIVWVWQNWDVTIMDSNGILDENWKWTHTVRYKTYTAWEWEQLCTQWIGWYKVEWYYESPAVQYSNQMSAAFKNATENANGKTADERTNLANAKRIYDTFSEMIDNWQMRDVILWSFWQDLFSNLVTQTFSSEEWTWKSFANALATTLERDYERWLIDNTTKAAITNFARAIEIKLRIESWAAISASEWQSNFLNYMPWQWKWLEADIAAMQAWDWLLDSWTSPHLTNWYQYQHLFDRTYIWNVVNWYNGSSNLDISDNNIPAWAKKKDTTKWYDSNLLYWIAPIPKLAYDLYNYFK